MSKCIYKNPCAFKENGECFKFGACEYIDNADHTNTTPVLSQFKIVWKTVRPSVGPIFYRGYVGKWDVFIVKSSLSDSSYILNCSLPGVKDSFKFEDIKSAQEHTINILSEWLTKAMSSVETLG